MSSAHEHDTGHDDHERDERDPVNGPGEAAGGRVLDFPGAPTGPFTAPQSVNGADPDRDPAVNAVHGGSGTGAGTGALNTPEGAAEGTSVVGPVVDGEVVTDPADSPDGAEGAGSVVRVDGPDTERDVGYLERLRSEKRRPLLPAWATSPTEFGQAARWVAAHYAHASAYHLLRVPKYAALLAARAPAGGWRVTSAVGRWVLDLEGVTVRWAVVRREDPEMYLKLSRQRDLRVRSRSGMAALVAAVVISAAVVGWLLTPPWVHALAVVVLVAGLGMVGRAPDARLLGTAVIATKRQKLTSVVVVRALMALGIGQINQTSKAGGGITFPSEIVRDGPGWRAEVDLPYGVTATDVLERRDKLASGLRRPLGCVWPEPAHAEHAGRLVLWVGDEDMSQAKPTPWPLARRGTADVFKPLPYGADQRGRRVTVPLMFANVLIGSIPRQGKTFAMRVLMLGCALDPLAELRVFELKGTGDLSAIEGCCHHYASGPDNDTIAACVASLDEVHAELDRRARVIRELPAAACPENMVTPELARRRDLRLHPIVIGVDECQELFTHAQHGGRAAELCTAIIKRGPAMGVILILATQRPDAKSLPTGISANVSIRLCLRVMGQLENDMVLGTSAYKNGIRATTFTPKDKGIGYLVGAADDPQIVRSDYIDAPAAQAIGHRARALREAASRLTGHAAGLDTLTATAGPPDTLLPDLLAVMPATEDKTWSENLAARLAAHQPDRYAGWRPEQLAAALKPHGVRTEQVWAAPDGQDGKPGNR
ncbi:MAG: cell division protein FtsK [Pseudonocardiaceae bacterium]|nr:cell division protein FtsK [Pseudonocardiaceae bacterium]